MKTPFGLTLGLGVILGLGILAFFTVPGLVSHRRAATTATEPIIIRFAHSQIEPNITAAFDALIAEYHARRPDVRVEQVTVPPRIYKSWIRTQLIGGTAPQLIELTGDVTYDLLARFFTPLAPWLQTPNPYNADTPLEAVPWQATFWDHLSSKPNYSDALVQHYGIPNTLVTRRIIFNRPLLQALTGSSIPPQSFADLLAVLAAAETWAAERRAPLQPLVAAKEQVEALLEFYVGAATHELKLATDPTRRRTGWDFEPAHAYLRGQWDFSTPAVGAGLSALRALGRYLPQSAAQVLPQDAAFTFLQGNALALVIGSGEAAALHDLAAFDFVVAPIPLPATDAAERSPWFQSRPSEADLRSVASFGLVRGAAHQDATIDFLHWMSSQETHQRFVDASRWNPVVRGVLPAAGASGFAPVLDGLPVGLKLALFGNETTRLIQTELHHLLGPRGSIARFVEAIGPRYPAALQQGWRRNIGIEALNLMRLDGAYGAQLFRTSVAPDAAASAIDERGEFLADLRADLELTQKWTDHALRRGLTRHD